MFSVVVIIPTLNEEQHIADCLESLLGQTYPFEKMDVMVVDGGSIDRTRDIVESFKTKYYNIRLINNDKRIQSVAFNIGVANSSAPFIVRLDAHAKYKERYIELCVKHLREKKEVGDVGGIWDIQPLRKGIIPESNAIVNKSRFGIGGAAYRVGAAAGYVDTVPFGAFPRYVVEEIGGMREDMPRAEDNDYVTRIKAAGYKIYLDPGIECVYYSRGTIYSFLKQKYADGKSIGHLYHVNREAIRLRHFVPLVFVSTTLSLLIASTLSSEVCWLLVIELCAYFMFDIIATLYNCLRYGFKFLLTLPWLFLLVHLSYGFGTIIGIIQGTKKNSMI